MRLTQETRAAAPVFGVRMNMQNVPSIPPPNVQAVARLGLDYRASLPQRLRGGTAVGLRRATQLANAEPVSVITLKRMRAWFDRNARFRDAPRRSRAFVAWLLWGGAAGRRWANEQLALRGM